MNRTRVMALIAGGVLIAGVAGGGMATYANVQSQQAAQEQAAVEAEREALIAAYAEKFASATPANLPKHTPEPVVEAVPVADEPAPEEPPAPSYGVPVPWIADPNPNNVEGGYWDTSACASGAAYQAPDGNQYCL